MMRIVPTINLVILLMFSVGLSYVIFTNRAMLAISHEFIDFDIQPTIFQDGEPQQLTVTATLNRFAPEGQCSLYVEQIVRDMTGSVVFSKIFPGTASDVGRSTRQTTTLVHPSLKHGCYSFIHRSTTDCGLRTLSRTSPERTFCVCPAEGCVP